MRIILPENKDNHFVVFDFRPTFQIPDCDYTDEMKQSDNYIIIVNKNILGENFKFFDNQILAEMFTDPYFNIKTMDFVKKISNDETFISDIIKKETEMPLEVLILPSNGCLYCDNNNPVLETLTVKFSEELTYDWCTDKTFYQTVFEDYLPNKTKYKTPERDM